MKEEKKGLKTFRDFLQEEEGMGTVEIILIIVVLIGHRFMYMLTVQKKMQNGPVN